MTMINNFSSHNRLILLLLPHVVLLTISPVAHASYVGSVTCHTGEDIPGPTHSGDSGGPLSNKGIIVQVDDGTAPSLTLVPNEINQVPAGIVHKLHIIIPDDTPSIGHYIRAGPSNVTNANIANVDASGALTIPPDSLEVTKGGTSWDSYGRPVTCEAGVSAITHVNIDPLTNIVANLYMPPTTQQSSFLNLEVNIMTDFPSDEGFFYTNFQMEFVPPETPVAAPSVAPSISTAPTTAPSLTQSIVAGSGSSCVSDVPEYDNMYALTDDLTFYWNTTTADSTTMAARLHSNKLAYVSWGVAPDTRGLMIGSEAIIGLPSVANSKSNPGKYHMVSKFLEGTFLMDEEQQTLIQEGGGSSITQDEAAGTTTLSFVKKLVEPGEVPILATGENTFMWAIGGHNGLGWHPDYGVFQLDLSAGCEALSRQGLHDHKADWIAHGAFMFIAWGIAAPLSLLAAQLGKHNVHVWANHACLMCTAIGMFISYRTTAAEGLDHFDGTHPTVGLVVFCLCLLQTVNAVVCIPTTSENANLSSEEQEEQKSNKQEVEITATLNETSIHNTHTDSTSNSSNDSSHSIAAVCYKRFHMSFARLVRYAVLGVATWLVYSGIRIYADNYSTSNVLASYFVVWNIAIMSLYGAWYIIDGARRRGKSKMNSIEGDGQSVSQFND